MWWVTEDVSNGKDLIEEILNPVKKNRGESPSFLFSVPKIHSSTPYKPQVVSGGLCGP